MKIILNGNEKDVNDGVNLLNLLNQYKINSDKPGAAIAINNDVILKSDWEHIKLKENDRIEIIKAVQGG